MTLNRPKAAILYFPSGHFMSNKQRPLTASMIRSLQLACSKQRHREAFGPSDIKGSFTSLIRRGLLKVRKGSFSATRRESWYVTDEAITMLKAVGIKVPC